MITIAVRQLAENERPGLGEQWIHVKVLPLVALLSIDNGAPIWLTHEQLEKLADDIKDAIRESNE